MLDGDEELPETVVGGPSRRIRSMGWASLPPDELVKRSLERIEAAVRQAAEDCEAYKRRVADLKR